MGLTRTIDPALLAAVLSPPFNPIVMVELEWSTGTVYAHLNKGTVSFGGRSWIGVGDYGSINIPGSGMGIGGAQAVLTIAGLPGAILAEAGNGERNRPGRILWGAVTEPGGNILIGDPLESYRGVTDGLRVRQSGDFSDQLWALEVTLRPGPPPRARAAVSHSPEERIDVDPTDTIGRHLANIQARVQTLKWPSS